MKSPLGEDKEPVEIAVAKRGRPAKNAAIYDDDRNMIITEDEHEEINQLVDDIKAKTVKLQKILCSGAKAYFRIGELLKDAEKRSTCRMTAKVYSEKTGVPERMVSTAIKIYKNFADNPEALEGVSIRAAAMLICPPDDKEDGPEQVSFMPELPQGQLPDYSEDFGLPTASGVDLHRFRLRADLHERKMYLIRKGYPGSFPIMEFSVEEPKNDTMQMAYDRFVDEVQKATEKYYGVVEQLADEEEEDA